MCSATCDLTKGGYCSLPNECEYVTQLSMACVHATHDHSTSDVLLFMQRKLCIIIVVAFLPETAAAHQDGRVLIAMSAFLLLTAVSWNVVE